MPRISRDGVRRRLISDRARRALDELSDDDLHQLREALREHANDSDNSSRQIELASSRDSIPRQVNPANYLAEGKKDERKYSRNSANPGFADRHTGEADDEDEHAGTRADMMRRLRAGHAPTWQFMREHLEPEDFDRLRQIVLADGDMDAPESPAAGGREHPLAGDSAHLPAELFSALSATRHIRVETSCVSSDRPTRRHHVMQVASDSRDTANFARMFPNASRVRLG